MVDWDASWTNDATITATLTAGTAQTGDAVNLDGKSGVAVGIAVTFGATVSNGGVLVQILRDVDGTNYEDANSAPRQFTIPATASTAVKKAFTVDARLVNKFKVRLLMPSGNSNGTSVAVKYNYQA